MEGLPDGLSDCSRACKDNCDKCQELTFPEIKYDDVGNEIIDLRTKDGVFLPYVKILDI